MEIMIAFLQFMYGNERFTITLKSAWIFCYASVWLVLVLFKGGLIIFQVEGFNISLQCEGCQAAFVWQVCCINCLLIFLCTGSTKCWCQVSP